jgi:hypothetical protein
VILTYLAVTLMAKKKRRIKCLKWVRNWRDSSKHSHANLLNEIRLEPTDGRNYQRMEKETLWTIKLSFSTYQEERHRNENSNFSARMVWCYHKVSGQWEER